MNDRVLTAAELEQRRDAPTTHGAHSAAKIVPRSKVLYDRTRKALNKAVGRTTPAERRQLRYLSLFEARIELSEQWLAEQPDPLFADRATGTLHPLIDRVDTWTERASRVVARLPERLVKALGETGQGDLAGAIARATGSRRRSRS